MKLPTKVRIDLLEFLRTGHFDCLRLGQTQEYILHNFPDPDDFDASWLTDPRSSRLSIWRYGNVELHFEGPRLFLVFSDYLDSLTGGPSLDIDPWILARPEPVGLLDVIRELNRERIDFCKERGSVGIVVVRLSSGVTLHFDPGDPPDVGVADPNEYRLSAFALQAAPNRREP
ncbi:MAG: hypothetical protein KDK70_07095 [Myxococcales bacterium]|nr:hypothetical protein [Myxococcales bacterium]